MTTSGDTDAVFGWERGRAEHRKRRECASLGKDRSRAAHGSRSSPASRNHDQASRALRDGNRSFGRNRSHRFTIEAKTIEATLFERVAQPGRPHSPAGPGQGTPPPATAAAPAETTDSAIRSMHASERLAIAFAEVRRARQPSARWRPWARSETTRCEGGSRARLTLRRRPRTPRRHGRKQTRVVLGTGELAQRLSSPEVTFRVVEGRISSARFTAPVRRPVPPRRRSNETLRRIVLASKDGAFVVGATGRGWTLGTEVVMTRTGGGGARRSDRSMRMTTSKLTLFSSSLLGSRSR